jgi:hypothetical protein
MSFVFKRERRCDRGINPIDNFDSPFNWRSAIVALQQELGILAQRRYRAYSFDRFNSPAAGTYLSWTVAFW